ncbi:helix-turn-helix domain-containing protein [Clostridium sp. MCC353]|uniref:helix-turn-helix domain-containing protein n=1 Tax=Clostridium sp. MCC353 TaxID=2592646 RepID=UPI001C00A26D|nr:helix-turn-helix transcriptional regulator [Clostridium sp. MCC353]MBT9775865.1 helix-turn-helix domain-containing protein [Clostridium sp. MCC353]
MKFIRIEELRENHDFTKKYAAYQLNISQRTCSHYENGTRQIPLDTLCRLAGFYHVSTDYILGRTDSKEPYPKTKSP